MSTFVRASKFRHVYCDPPRLDAQYTNLRLSTATGEQNYIKANSLFLAYGAQVTNLLRSSFLDYHFHFTFVIS